MRLTGKKKKMEFGIQCKPDTKSCYNLIVIGTESSNSI